MLFRHAAPPIVIGPLMLPVVGKAQQPVLLSRFSMQSLASSGVRRRRVKAPSGRLSRQMSQNDRWSFPRSSRAHTGDFSQSQLSLQVNVSSDFDTDCRAKCDSFSGIEVRVESAYEIGFTRGRSSQNNGIGGVPNRNRDQFVQTNPCASVFDAQENKLVKNS
jgi:hypothetical protein